MAEDIHGSAGTSVFIGPVTAASDITAYAALTPWVEIGKVESVSEFGDSAGTGTWTGLKDSRVRKYKTARDAGDVTVVCAHDPLDAGQIAAIAAEATKFGYAIKIVTEDSADANDTDSTFYFHAKVMSKRLGVGANSDLLKRTFVLAIDTAIFEDLSEAVS